MRLIIIYSLFLILYSCERKNDANTKKKISQIMVEFYTENSTTWRFLQEINYERASLADGCSFLAVLEMQKIEDFILKNRAKQKTLLNDSKEYFNLIFLQNPLLDERFSSKKCKFFAHSFMLKGNNRLSSLFVCINLDNKQVIFHYTEN